MNEQDRQFLEQAEAQGRWKREQAARVQAIVKKHGLTMDSERLGDEYGSGYITVSADDLTDEDGEVYDDSFVVRLSDHDGHRDSPFSRGGLFDVELRSDVPDSKYYNPLIDIEKRCREFATLMSEQ